MRQQRVVEDEAPIGTYVREHEEHGGKEPVALLYQEHRGYGGYAQPQKRSQELLLCRAVICQYTEDWGENGDYR